MCDVFCNRSVYHVWHTHFCISLFFKKNVLLNITLFIHFHFTAQLFQLRLSNQSIDLQDKTARLYEKSATSRLFSEDLRWRAIWMKEMLGYQVDEVAAVLGCHQEPLENVMSQGFKFRRSESKHRWKTDKKYSHAPVRHWNFLSWKKSLNTPKRHYRTFKSNDDGNGNYKPNALHVRFKFSYISLRPLQNNKVK